MNSLRILVVDDSALYRKLLVDLIGNLSGMEVIGTAHGGKTALEKIERLKPDVVTLDIEMPDMDGFEVLRRMKKAGGESLAIMVSSHTQRGAKVTMDALDHGAFDFVSKPEGVSPEESRSTLAKQLGPILAGARARKASRLPVATAKAVSPAAGEASNPSTGSLGDRMRRLAGNTPPEIVVIGISTGGPAALGEMLPMLPVNLKVPVVIVQHIPEGFSESLVESLNRKCSLPVKVGREGEEIVPGTIYIAPGGCQMKVVSGAIESSKSLQLTNDPAENNCRPSVDYLMRSVAHLYQDRALGVIMTGMGADGVLGLQLMKRHGVDVIAQDEASCVVFGMPAEAIKAGVVDFVVPLRKIAADIVSRVECRPGIKA